MQIRIRIYLHDLDLYSLYETIGKREFIKVVKKILNSYATDNSFVAEPIFLKEPDLSKKVISTLITVNENKMPEVVTLLSNITEKRKNAFIKQLIRFYLADTFLQLYLKGNINKLNAPIADIDKKTTDIQPVNNTIKQNEIIEKEVIIKKPKNRIEHITKEPETEPSIQDNSNSINDLAGLFAGITGM